MGKGNKDRRKSKRGKVKGGQIGRSSFITARACAKIQGGCPAQCLDMRRRVCGRRRMIGEEKSRKKEKTKKLFKAILHKERGR